MEEEHPRKVVLWVVGVFHILTKHGLINGDAYGLTAKGLARWDQLAMEFQPTNDDLEAALSLMRIKPGDVHAMKALLVLYRDGKLTFQQEQR